MYFGSYQELSRLMNKCIRPDSGGGGKLPKSFLSVLFFCCRLNPTGGLEAYERLNSAYVPSLPLCMPSTPVRPVQ